MNNLLVLRTKFFIPKLNNNFVGINIYKKTIIWNHKKLVLVSAPAGYGKTSLVLQWIKKNNNLKIAWFSIEENDNNSIRFIFNLVYSIKEINNSFGSNCLKELSNSQIKIEYILIILINEIINLEEDLYLVIDDYHLITSQEVIDIINFLIKNTSDKFHLIITSRHNSNLPLITLRGTNSLEEVNIDCLSFSRDEIYKFFKNNDLILDSNIIDIIFKETEGWVLSLQLILYSIKKSSSADSFFQNFKSRNLYINEYLTSEILNNLRPDIKSFLLKTSIFEKFSIELCDYLGLKNTKEIINYLIEKNLFLIQLDNKNEWFRYHNLFSELLNKYIDKEYPDKLLYLHKNSSLWFSNNNMIEESIKHLLFIKDWETLSELIKLKVYNKTTETGEYHILYNCFIHIPKDYIYSNIFLSIYYLWSLNSTFRFDVLRYEIEQINKLVKNKYNNKEIDFFSPKSQILLIKVGLLIKEENYDEALILSKLALKLSNRDNKYIKSIINFSLGLLYNKIKQANKSMIYLDGVINYSKINLNNMLIVKSLRLKVSNYKLLNKINTSRELVLNIFSMIKDKKINNKVINLILNFELAEIYYIQDDLSSFYNLYNDFTEKSSSINEYEIIYELYNSYLQILINIRDFDNSNKCISIMENILNTNILKKTHFLQILFSKLKMYLLKNMINDSKNLLKNEIEPIIDKNIHFDYKKYIIELNIISSNIELAYDLIDKLILELDKKNNLKDYFYLIIMKSDILYKLNQKSESIKILKNLLKITESENCIRNYVDYNSKNIYLLLLKILSSLEENNSNNKDSINYIKRIISSYKSFYNNIQLNYDNKDKILLTKREIEIIKFMEKGYSNNDISEISVVSINTIKAHKKNIYKKLNVKSSEMAIFKCKSLNII